MSGTAEENGAEELPATHSTSPGPPKAPATVGAMRRSLTGAVLGTVVLAGALAGCDAKTELQAPQAQPTPEGVSAAAVEFANQLRERVTIDAMMGHLEKLQEIADNNDGNRALGTPGYDASVDYVVSALRDKGFDVETRSSRCGCPTRRTRR